MAFIIKKGPGIKNMDRKTAYVWGACLLVFIFVLFALFTVMGGKSDVKPDDFTGMNPKAFDLAQLPFANDAAEKELLDKYTDLDGNLPESTLYSPEEKEERQAADAFSGIPTAPDEEYKAAEKDIPDTSPASRNYGYGGGSARRASPTMVGQLQSGSIASGSGLGSRGTTWSPSNMSDRNNGYGNGKIATTKETVDKLKNSQTGRSLLGIEGALADASKKNAEGAAHGLAKAYAQGKDVSAMDGDMEKALAGLDAGKGGLMAGKAGGGPSASDVAKAIENAPKEKPADKKDNKECSGYWDCLWRDSLKNLTNGLVDMGTSWLKSKTIGDNNSFSSQMKGCLKLPGATWDNCSQGVSGFKVTNSSSNSNNSTNTSSNNTNNSNNNNGSGGSTQQSRAINDIKNGTY
ncbi:MAG: hypothetical protein LBI01_06835 [Elusimicrobium sp.]|jgi:hypothetical protein|nr:hypothetical protein [Elusimicrobium sp.]